ncbi:MAG: Hpt domain-containing protein [Erysipelotrichaceae bacterium]|nr:Hpt domain-containing protein [Erysipelotrichaceae bacterium]
MTLKELYEMIDGDYEQAVNVLRVDKLIDKHVRKICDNEVVTKLIDAREGMDPTVLFEAAHAMKGVCGNLGLTTLAKHASDIAEEYRPGNERKMSDDEVKGIIDQIEELYKKTCEAIREYQNQ